MTVRFQARRVKVQDRSYPYALYLPDDIASDEPRPIVLFLHGAAERGTDGSKPTRVGLGPALGRHPDRYPAIVVFPQCPPGEFWSPPMLDIAMAALETVALECGADADRAYVTGISMGGFGTYLLGATMPDRFAALVPICGGGEAQAMAEKLKDLPIWIFHGAADPVVHVEYSREMAQSIRAAGGTNVRYTEYPRVAHNSWDRAYDDPALPAWLFAQRRYAPEPTTRSAMAKSRKPTAPRQ